MKRKIGGIIIAVMLCLLTAVPIHASSNDTKDVWVRIPDVRYGKLNVAFPVPAQYADECKEMYFTGYTAGDNYCHAVQYLCASTMRGVEFYYFNDYSSRPQLLGICKGVPIGKYRYFTFINGEFGETDIDGLEHWILNHTVVSR